MSHPVQPAPNYTNATLVMGFVNLTWFFIAIWLWLGYPVFLLTAYVIKLAIDRLGRRKRR